MPEQVTATFALSDQPFARPVLDGSLLPDWLRIDRQDIPTIHRAFRPMLRDAAYDVCELAIVSSIQGFAEKAPVIPLPVTVAARFQHKCLVHNRTRGALAPGELAGKRVGVRAYTVTTGAWVRTILAREYGVDIGAVTWVTQEGPHAGGYTCPDNVVQLPEGSDLVQMLRDGEIDAAIFGNDMPREDWLAPVIPNPEETALERFRQDGIISINHILTVSRPFATRAPDAVRAVYAAFVEAKRQWLAKADPALPDLLPVGLAAMQPSVDVIAGQCLSQRLIDSPVDAAQLFAEALDLIGDAAR